MDSRFIAVVRDVEKMFNYDGRIGKPVFTEFGRIIKLVRFEK